MASEAMMQPNVSEGRRRYAAAQIDLYALFEQMAQGVVYQDAAGAIVLANPAAEEILGLTLEEMQGQKSIDPRWRAIHEDGSDFPGETHPAMVALRSGQPVKDVMMGVYHPRQATYRWILVSSCPEFHPGETRPHQVFTTFTDVTAHKHAEEKLARVTAAVPGLIYSFRLWPDGSAVLSYASPMLFELCGFAPETLYRDASPLLANVHLEDRPGLLATMARAAEALAPWHAEFRYLHPEKGEIWMESRAMPILEADGGVTWHGYAADISERRRAAVAEERAHTFLQRVLDALATHIAILDDAGVIVRVNGAWRHFGVENDLQTPDHGLGTNYLAVCAASFSLGAPEAGAMAAAIRSMLAQTSTRATIEYPCHSDTVQRWFNANVTGFEEEGRRFVVVAHEDITERKVAEEALRRSEAQQRASVAKIEKLIDLLPVGVSVLDQNRNVVKLNAALQRILRLGEAEILRGEHRARRYIRPDGSPFPPEEFASARVIRGEPEALNVETGIVLEDGTVLWADVSAVGCAIADWSSIVVTADITARKQAELALRASEEKYRVLMNSLDSAVVVLDAEGRVVYLNDVASKRSGITTHRNVTLADLVPEPEATDLLDLVRQVIHEDLPLVVETASQRGAAVRWFRGRIQPLHDEFGHAAFALVNSTDITDLKQTQRQLEELNRSLEQRVLERTVQVQDLYDNAPAGYHSLDVDGNFVMMNQTELDWLGYRREEVIGRLNIREVLTDEGRRQFAERFPVFLRQGWIRNLEYDFVRKDGSLLPVSLSASAIYDDAGQYVMNRATVIDITERRQAEVALRRHQEELSSANAALAKAAQMKDEFLASMSHELRTPLTGILGLSEALQGEVYGPLNGGQLAKLHSIEESGRHLLNLINDILDLSKIEAGRLELEPSVFLVDELCQASLRLVKEMARAKQHMVSYRLYPAGVRMVGDIRRLKQALVNLLSNAVKFTPEQGKIGLDVHADADRQLILLAVWDNGIGIAPEDVEKLFKPFVQLDSRLARSQNGTGLGLSLVQRLAELHRGRVTLESTPGRGSRFTLVLPWTAEQGLAHDGSGVHEASAPATQPVENTTTSFALGPALLPQTGTGPTAAPKLLLAEDHALNRQLLADYLARKGYAVETAENGAEAVRAAEASRPALLLMDIQMPGVDGLEAVRILRNSPDKALAHLPIIAITALAMAGDRERCLAAGADAYVSKPLNLEALHRLIQTLLAERAGTAS